MAESISEWIGSLKAGNATAAQNVWERCSRKLVELAQTKIGEAPKTIADEEDVAQSVFRSICGEPWLAGLNT